MVSISSKGKQIIGDLINQAINEGKVPGVGFAVTTIQKEIYAKSAGLRVLNEPSAGPVNDESVFWVCSMTKLVTSLALLQLVEKGKVSLDTPVAELVPHLKDPIVLDESPSLNSTYKPAKNVMKIAHLLNHSSGLFDHTPRDRFAALPTIITTAFEKDDPLGHYHRMMQGSYPSIPLQFEPGTDFVYGLSSDTVGFIVEKVSGQRLGDYCKENIFDPLGLTSSFYLKGDVKKQAVSLTYRNKHGQLEICVDQTPLIQQDPEKLYLHLGGIGLYTNLKDYLTLLRHLMQIHAGHAVENPILNKGAVDALFEPSLTEAGVKSLELFSGWPHCQWSTALCLNTADWSGKRKKGSAFWYGWAGTYYFMDPTTGIAVAFGTQVVPTRDPEVVKLWDQLEMALYANLEDDG